MKPEITQQLRESETVELYMESAPDVQFRQIAGLFVASFDRPSFLVETVDKEETPQNHMKPQESNKKTTRKN